MPGTNVYVYTVERADDGSYRAHIPALPGCTIAGDSPEDIEGKLHEAIDSYLSAHPESRPTSHGKIGDMTPTPTTREEIHSRFRDAFSTTDAARILPWLMPAIGFRDKLLGVEPKSLGTTRFGGRPDLDDSTPWPQGPNGPLAFLGQIALGGIAALDVDRVLPDSGLLLFFYNIADYAWGREAGDREKFAVVYIPGAASLSRREFPADLRDVNRIARCRIVSAHLGWELPTSDPLATSELGFGAIPTIIEPARDAFTESYWALDLVLPYPRGTHKLLGWANGIYQQNEDARLMCELARRGFPETSEAIAAAHEDRLRWRCLLEVSNDHKLYNDYWADGGTIAFFIRDDDLRRRDFSQCWCVLSSS